MAHLNGGLSPVRWLLPLRYGRVVIREVRHVCLHVNLTEPVLQPVPVGEVRLGHGVWESSHSLLRT